MEGVVVGVVCGRGGRGGGGGWRDGRAAEDAPVYEADLSLAIVDLLGGEEGGDRPAGGGGYGVHV